MAVVHAPDLRLHRQPDGSAQADTGVLRATLAPNLAADELLRVEVAQKALTYAAGVLAWVDRQGNHQAIAAIAPAPLQVEGSGGRFAPEGVPYIVEYEIEGRRVKRRVILTAPLPDPDPEVFPDLDGVRLSVFGPLNIDPSLTMQVKGQSVTDGMWTADAIDLVDEQGNVVERLDRIWARATGDESLVCAGQYRLVQDPVSGCWQVYEAIPYWWLRTLAPENYPVVIDPTVVATASYSFPTFGRGKRTVDRCSDGTLWIAIADSPKTVRFMYSKDNGSTWLESTSSAISDRYSPTSGVDIFIDADDYMHIVYDGGENDLFYRRGTPDANRTAWTWSQAYVVEISAPRNGAVVAHREGSGWVAHIVYGLESPGQDEYRVFYRRATIGPDGSISLSSVQRLDYGIIQYMPYVAIDFNHTGDGKTVAGAPHLYVAWSRPHSVCFTKATYSSGNWTWGKNVVIENTGVNSGRLAAAFDGTRFVMVYSPVGATSTIKVAERDAADTTTFLTPPSLSDGTIIGVTPTYDQNQNLYVFAAGDTSKDVKMVKFDRATGTWGAWTTVAEATAVADTLTCKRGYGGNVLDVVWSDGSAAPYTVYHHRILLNRAPNAPTVTVSPAAFDAASGADITVTHNDPDGDDMSAYALMRVLGTQTEWWDATAKAWVTTEKFNAAFGASVTIPAADNAGTWVAGQAYQLYAATKDAQGLVGPYNSIATIANAGAKPVAQITAPTGTVAQQQVTVQWTVDQPQGAYQIKLLDSGGATVEDTGKVESTSARERTLATVLENNAQYTVELRVWDQTSGGGVPSDPVTVVFNTSFTVPPTPLITVTPQQVQGVDCYLRIAVTNPASQGDEPNVVYNDIYRRRVGDIAWVRIATGIAPNGFYDDYAVASGETYEYFVRAQADNTTSADSAVAAGSITLEPGAWLHDPLDPAGTIRRFEGVPDWDEDWQPVSGEFRFAGRSLPVVEFDESQAEQVVRVQLLLPDGTGDREALEALAARRTTVLYRDYRGRKVYGVIRGLRFQDEPWGAVADLEVYAVEYEEAVP